MWCGSEVVVRASKMRERSNGRGESDNERVGRNDHEVHW